ncbi:hypothetical protein [Mycobacterium sp. 141]|uniref:hypothetical protein n=1 Tax=Mycobacterium sp. 141 TaxID=1120797 RepID=UPI000367045A|nr:hypothetical protein [Mycobacterium sp. 141]
MKTKRPAPASEHTRRRNARKPARAAARRATEAPPRTRRPGTDQRRAAPAPATGPIPRPKTQPVRPKSTSQAKARAKARKAKAPKVIRPPLRERLLVRLASIELNPRELIARVPFVALVIAALGFGLGVTLWLSTGSAERSYELGHARQTTQGLQQQKEALERDVLEAQAAPALAEAARNLGMIPSRDTAHLVQDPTGSWTVVGTPKPAEGVPPPPMNVPLPDPTTPPPAPPAPPAPRVIDPREVTVHMPEPGQVLPGQPAPAPQIAAPPAAPLVAPPAAPLVAAPAPAPAAAPPLPAPVADAPPAVVPAPVIPAPAAPVPAPGPPVAGVPLPPGPPPGAGQFAPADAPVPAPAA